MNIFRGRGREKLFNFQKSIFSSKIFFGLLKLATIFDHVFLYQPNKRYIRRAYGELTESIRRAYGENTESIRREYGELTERLPRSYGENTERLPRSYGEVTEILILKRLHVRRLPANNNSKTADYCLRKIILYLHIVRHLCDLFFVYNYK